MEFWKNISVTKLVFLLLILVLCFTTIYNTINGNSYQLFENVILMVTSFYFGQKVKPTDDNGTDVTDPLINE